MQVTEISATQFFHITRHSALLLKRFYLVGVIGKCVNVDDIFFKKRKI